MNSYYTNRLITSEGGKHLAVSLQSSKAVMDYQVEMIAANEVVGLLDFRYLTSDGKPCFFYDINGFMTLGEYIEAYGQSIRFLAETLMEISVTIGNLDKFLLEEKCLLLDPDKIYIDPVRKGVKLIYLPVDIPEEKQTFFSGLVLDMVGKFRPEDATGKLFCRRIIEEVKKAGFRYEAFTDFLLDIICYSGGSQNGAAAGGAYESGYSEGVQASVYARLNPGASPVNNNGGKPKSASDPGMLIKRFSGLFSSKSRGGEAAGKSEASGKSAAAGMGQASGKGPMVVKGTTFVKGTNAVNGTAAENGKLSSNMDNKNGQGGGENEKTLTPVLAAIGVVVLYFLVNSLIPDYSPNGMTYRSAALLAAIGAEALLLKHFISGAAAQGAPALAAAPGGGGFSGAVQAAVGIHKISAKAEESNAQTISINLWEDSVDNETGMDTADSDDTDGLDEVIKTNEPDDDAYEPDDADDAFDSYDPDYADEALDLYDPDGLEDEYNAIDDDDEYASGETFSCYENDEFQTELLSCGRKIYATLYIKDSRREYGVPLTEDEFTIGRRKETSGLVLDNPAVGKTHAKLIKKNDIWYIKDMASKNGTYLNNLKLEYAGEKTLCNSDLITIANVDMLFILNDK